MSNDGLPKFSSSPFDRKHLFTVGSLNDPRTPSLRKDSINVPISRRRSINVTPGMSRRSLSFRSPNVYGSMDKRVNVSNHYLIDMNSPNFATQDANDREEINNSVRENYLNENYKPMDTISTHSHSLHKKLFNDVQSQKQDTNDEFQDADLKRPAGDITRDIYKITSNQNQFKDKKRTKDFDDVALTMERNRRKSTASGLNVPGGFRREFIVHKMRKEFEEHDSASVTNSSKHCSRTLLESNHSATSLNEMNEMNEMDELESVPFLTRNFLEFLYLYGHFAGESFVDDFFNSEDEQFPKRPGTDERGNLLPIGSKSTRDQVSAVRGTTSTKRAFLLLLKSFVGTGVLFLPRAFANGGLTLSIILLAIFGIYSYWCYYILIQCKVHTGVSSFGEIGLELYGNWLRIIILFALGITQLGFAGAYMIFTAKNLDAFLKNIFQLPTTNLGSIMIFQLFVFIPLSFIRNVSKLSIPSLFANFCIMLGLAIILVFFLKELIFVLNLKPANGIIYGINWDHWSLFIGTAIFAFEGIGLLIPVQESMKNPKDFPKVLALVIVTVTIMFILMATLGYVVFGSDVQTVILLNLPQDSIFVNMIQLLYSMAIMLSTPLQLFPAIKIIEDKLFPKFTKIYVKDNYGAKNGNENADRNADEETNELMHTQYVLNSGKVNWRVKWLKNLVRSIIVSIVVLYAYFGIDYLDKVVAVIGSFCCLPLVYVVPPLLHLKNIQRNHEKNQVKLNHGRSNVNVHDLEDEPPKGKLQMLRYFDYVLILFGIISMLYTSYQSLVS